MSGAQTSGERTCGACSLCCKLMGVKSIAKPPHLWCGHFKVGTGCAVYVDRPTECVAFSCQWLKWSQLGEDWRPDRARFVLHLEQEGRRLDVEVEPAHPQAWRRAPYHAQFKAWAAQGATQGLAVRVWVGTRAFDVLPHADIDLGDLRPDPASALARTG